MRAADEEGFQQTVIDLAHFFGWRVASFRKARTNKGWRTPVGGDGKGWLDLVLLRGSVILFRELKVDGGRLTPEQSRWLADLTGAGQDAGVWTPEMWDVIERTLRDAGVSAP